VNHDLIAAGHPPLRFELGAYHEQLPKHWDFAGESAPDSRFEARLWLAGQIESSRAALQLAHNRKVWPELAEYDCESCHHAIDGRPTAALGRPLWGTWYFSPQIIAAIRGSDPLDLQMPLTELREAMNRFAPQHEIRPITQLLLDAWPPGSPEIEWSDASIMLKQPADSPLDRTWSAAAQRWLARGAIEDSSAQDTLRALQLKLANPGRFQSDD
jgi:hypothetical protein